MICRLVVVALLFATPAAAQVCRGHQSFAAHRARAAVQVLNPTTPGSSSQLAMGLAYGLTRQLFVSGDYVGESVPLLGGVDDAITHDGGEGFVGVQFGDERLGSFALCPLLGFGFRGTNGSTLLGSSDIRTRSTIGGLALGAAPLLSRAGIRLLPSIELQVRFDRSEGSSTFSGTTTATNSKDQYLVTTVGLGVAIGHLTFTPLYQRRFDERLISWGFRVSFNFGPAID